MLNFNEFSERLQSLRKRKNMTQGELADRLGVTSQAVSKWENSQSYPDITLIPTIATIFDVEINYLFGKQTETIKNDISFPKSYKGMPFIHSYQNIACYSSKIINSIDGSGMKFTDGSTVELSNHLVVNIGEGEIQLLIIDSHDENIDLSDTTKVFEFDYADSADIEVLSNKCEIIRSYTDKCKVTAKGLAYFIKMLDIRHQDDKLILRFDNKGRDNNNSYQRNNILIELPCETGKNIEVKVNGSGELKSEIDKFENGRLFINGSGIINMRKFDTCNSSINGSGVINALYAEETNLAINGSGNINWDTAQNLIASINGSGDIEVKNARSINVGINGSGDLSINKLSDLGDVTLKISGSGDIKIKDGYCQKFDVVIDGAGNIDATNVTAKKASIIIKSNGGVTLGRVIDSSVEQIKKKGTITILNRGEVE